MKLKHSLLLAALMLLPGIATAQQSLSPPPGPMAGPGAEQSPPTMREQRHPEGMEQDRLPHGAPPAPLAGALPAPIWLHGIKLSEDQEEQLFKIIYAQLPTLHEQAKILRHAHEDLRTAPFSEKYDAAKVKSLTESISRAIATLELTRATADSRIYALLTAEQRQQVQAQINRQIGMEAGLPERGPDARGPGKQADARPDNRNPPPSLPR
jgi:protein CpxP